MGAPVVVGARRPRPRRCGRMLPPDRRAMVDAGTPDKAARRSGRTSTPGSRASPSTTTCTARTDQIAALGELLRGSPREAVPVPRRARRRHRRPVAARDARARRGRSATACSCTPDHLVIPFGFVPLLAYGRRRRPSGSGSRRSSPTTTCATPRCWPRTSRRSTCCPAAASRSRSARAGTGRSTTAIGMPFDPVGVRVVAARRGGRGPQGLLRATGRSRSRASTTRSPSTTGSRSRSSGRIRRCSSAAAAGGC